MERLDALRFDLRIHQNTLTVNLGKCKRPASVLLDDMDYEIEQGTGRLLPMDGHMPYAFSALGKQEAQQYEEFMSETQQEILFGN